MNGMLPRVNFQNSPDPNEIVRGRGVRLVTVCVSQFSSNTDTLRTSVSGEEVDVEVSDACQQKLTSVSSEDFALRSAGVRSARVSEDYPDHYGGLVPVSPESGKTEFTEPAEEGDEMSGTMPCAKYLYSSDPTEVAKERGVRPATVCTSQHSNMSPESPCGEEVKLEDVEARQPKSRTRVLSEDSARTSVGVPRTRVLSIVKNAFTNPSGSDDNSDWATSRPSDNPSEGESQPHQPAVSRAVHGDLLPSCMASDVTDSTKPVSGGDGMNGRLSCANFQNSPDPNEIVRGRGVRPSLSVSHNPLRILILYVPLCVGRKLMLR